MSSPSEDEAYCQECGRLVTEFLWDKSLKDLFVGLADWADVQAEGFRPGSHERATLADLRNNLLSWADDLPLALQTPFTLKHRHAVTDAEFG